jgi:hypothetical protein
MIHININKLPRPERSGTLAVVIAYVLLTGAGDINAARFVQFSSAENIWDLLCWVMPCSVLWPPHKPDPPPHHVPPSKQWQTSLYFGTAKEKDTDCRCHVDIRYPRKAIEHITWEARPTCGEESAPIKGWIPGPLTVNTTSQIIFIGSGEGEARWHCGKGE